MRTRSRPCRSHEPSRSSEPDLRSRLPVKRPVTPHEPGAKAAQDHLGGLVEPFPRFVHRPPEGLELPPGEAATDPEAQAAAAEMVEDGHLLDDAQGIVPGQDHRRGPEIDIRADGREVGHELQVVRAERVVVEVVLHGPQHIEAEIRGQAGET
jgi:hypothetical protein